MEWIPRNSNSVQKSLYTSKRKRRPKGLNNYSPEERKYIHLVTIVELKSFTKSTPTQEISTGREEQEGEWGEGSWEKEKWKEEWK